MAGRGVGIAIKGVGKVLSKVPVLGKHARVARQTVKRIPKKKKDIIPDKIDLRPIKKQVKKAVKLLRTDPRVSYVAGVGWGAAAGAAGIEPAKKAYKKTKEKLTKSVEEHKKKTKEQKEKQKK